eukprot:snap_masked-scaffold593_size129216-processed-gene-0.15 protein:Tk12034 transcript:snap_masked-scaffold593_size129216-processed-gene-0.15-mRNA-1 annotation:"Obscurin"
MSSKVSWLRHQGETIELLTVGDTTYSGDSRINISYEYPNNWRLNISDVQKVDSGLYVCQISSFPPKALFANLQVQDALVEVIDSDGRTMKTQYYNPGSEIELTCVVRSRDSWSTEVKWLKDGVPLDLNHRASVRSQEPTKATALVSVAAATAAALASAILLQLMDTTDPVMDLFPGVFHTLQRIGMFLFRFHDLGLSHCGQNKDTKDLKRLKSAVSDRHPSTKLSFSLLHIRAVCP